MLDESPVGIGDKIGGGKQLCTVPQVEKSPMMSWLTPFQGLITHWPATASK
jgi:hypothetical protein